MAGNLPEGYALAIIDPMQQTDEQIVETNVLGVVLELEAFPEDPPTPPDVAIAAVRSGSPRFSRWQVQVRAEDGTLVSTMGISKDWDFDTNPDVGGLQVNIHPDHRGRGIGRALIAQRVAFARALEQTRFFPNTHSRRPAGPALCESLGAVAKTWMHTNQLLIADVDRPMLEGWVAEAADRSAGYELLVLEGHIPDDLVDAMVDLILVMNTAPRDGLEVNDFTLTVGELREGEQQEDAMGIVHWTVITREVATGALAGFHDIAWVPWEPENVYVHSTGVRPEHRGHALGKWLKAAMTLKLMDDMPEVRRIRTGNADSNDAMLGINHKMGYAPYTSTATWEVSREQVESWLIDRGIEIPDVSDLVVRPTAGAV